MRRSPMVLAIVIGLLVGAGVVGVLLTADDSTTSVNASLPKLPFGAAARETAALAADAPFAAVTYEVRGQLPDLPREAKAYKLNPADAGRAERIAKAFGFDTPQRFGEGWAASDGVRRLSVSGATWSFGPDCSPPTADTPSAGIAEKTVTCSAMASSGSVAACAPDGACAPMSPPPTLPGLPTKDAAITIARKALAAAGIDTSGAVSAYGPSPAWEVSIEPEVGGAPVVGLANRVTVGSNGAITGGGGQLVDPDELGTYPLVSVSEGVERLKAGTYGGGGVQTMELRVDGPPTQTRIITGAHLGLMASYGSNGSTYLTPAFLFELEDAPDSPMPVPAVIDRLLEELTPPPGPKPLPPNPSGPPQQVPPAPPSAGGGGSSGAGQSQACAGSSSAANTGGEDNRPVTIEVCASPSNPRVGETVTFSLKASDPDAAMDAEGCQQPTATYGDESRDEMQAHCMSLCSRESYPPEAGAIGRTFTHVYDKAGTYTATFTADSCAPKNSHGQVQLQIVVRG